MAGQALDFSSWAQPDDDEQPAGLDFSEWAAPQQRTAGQRFWGNVVDAASRNPTVATVRETFVNPASILPRTGVDAPDFFEMLGPVGTSAKAAISTLGLASRALPANSIFPRAPDIAQAERERRAGYDAESQADPFYKAGDGAADKFAAGASTLGGQLVGAALDPQNWAGAGRTWLQRAGSNAGINAAGDVQTQSADVRARVQDQYSPGQTASAAALGAGLSVAGDAAGAGLRALRGPRQSPDAQPDFSSFADGQAEPLALREQPPASDVAALDFSSFASPELTIQRRPAVDGDQLWTRLTQAESGSRQFDDAGRLITSPKGAFGKAQLMPDTAAYVAKRLGRPELADLARSDEAVNEFLGRAYYDEQLEDFGGDHLLATAAYNAGPGRVRDWLRTIGDPDTVGRAEWAQRIPFKETREYVRKILGAEVGASRAPKLLTSEVEAPQPRDPFADGDVDVGELSPPASRLPPPEAQGGASTEAPDFAAALGDLSTSTRKRAQALEVELGELRLNANESTAGHRLDYRAPDGTAVSGVVTPPVKGRGPLRVALDGADPAQLPPRLRRDLESQLRVNYPEATSIVGLRSTRARGWREEFDASGRKVGKGLDELAEQVRRTLPEGYDAAPVVRPDGRVEMEISRAGLTLGRVSDPARFEALRALPTEPMPRGELIAAAGRVLSPETASGQGVSPALPPQLRAAVALNRLPRIDQGAGGAFTAPSVSSMPNMAPAGLSPVGAAPPQLPRLASTRQPGGLRDAPQLGPVARADAPEGFGGQTVSQLAGSLRATLGLAAHRQGRLSSGRAVGEYDPSSAVIRTRTMHELDVLSHEGGHALDHKGGPALKATLQAHAADLSKLAYPGANPQHVREEGFAEFFRWYLTNPDHARRIAPEFYDAFEGAIAADNPKMARELRGVQSGYQQLLNAASLDVAAASVAYTGRPGPVGRVKKALTEKGLGGAVMDLADDAYTALVDGLHPIAKAVRTLQDIYAENHAGARLDLNVAQNPYALARLAPEAYAAGHVDLMDGVVPYRGVDPEGPSLSQALEKALGARAFGKWDKADLNRFDAYLISRRMVHEWDRYAAGELDSPPDGKSRQFHEQVIADAEAMNPTWGEAADMVYGWNERLWKKEHDAGFITDESYTHGLTAHPDYVPLMRDMSDRGPGGSGKPRGAMQFAGGVKRFEGSTRDIISPLSSMMRRAYELNAAIKRNDALKALDDLAQKAGPGAGAIVERLPQSEIHAFEVNASDALAKAAEAAGFGERDVTTLVNAVETALSGETMATMFRHTEIEPKKGERIVFAWRDGKKQPLLLPDGAFGQEMYRALTAMTQDMQSWVVDIMAAGSQMLRYGVTLSPEFMSRNIVRDQLATWINTDVGFVPFVHAAKGMKSAVTDDATAKRYATAGGMRGGPNVAATRKPFPRDDVEALDQLQHLQKKGYRVKRYASWRGLAELTDLSETSTRLGVFGLAFKQAKGRGLDDYDAMLEAAFTSRDYLDFGRRGSRMLSAVRIVTFLNAALQGLDKSTRVLTAGGNLHKVLAPFGKNAPRTDGERRALQHAWKAWAKVSVLGALGLSLRALYADDPEYEEIGDRLRATHWVAKVQGQWVFIPKPFELATLSNILERGFEASVLKDPTALERLRSDFSHTIAPPHETPSISVPFAVAANRDNFGRPIVPEHLRGAVDPERQFNAYTSKLGRKIGETLGVSPAVVDYVITGFGGSMGRYLLQGTNLATEAATGAPATASGPEDFFLSRGFVRDVSRGATSQKAFWDLVGRSGGELTRAEGTFRQMMKEGDDGSAATAYLNELSPEARAYVRMKALTKGGVSGVHPMVRAEKVLSTIADLRREVRAGDVMGPDLHPVALTPSQRKEVDDALANYAMTEMRNALIATGVEGWKQKKFMPVRDSTARVFVANGAMSGVLNQRLRAAKVLPPEQAGQVWMMLKPRMEAPLSNGEEAITRKRLRSSDAMARLREVSRLRMAAEEEGAE